MAFDQTTFLLTTLAFITLVLKATVLAMLALTTPVLTFLNTFVLKIFLATFVVNL
jgi:hypothetical protein